KKVNGKPARAVHHPLQDYLGVSVSRELLTVGSDYLRGIWDRLLSNSKPPSRKTSSLQTVQIERSLFLNQFMLS
uniref:Uncharacterized protein n=1 Tax=Prolemur simus TaxID=1328070 RepID=A0A8C8YW72_PROSS